MATNLATLRSQIDALDRQLLELLNQRARVAQDKDFEHPRNVGRGNSLTPPM